MASATRGGRFGEYNYRCACIAQLVEQLTLNQLVPGSNPGAGISPPFSPVFNSVSVRFRPAHKPRNRSQNSRSQLIYKIAKVQKDDLSMASTATDGTVAMRNNFVQYDGLFGPQAATIETMRRRPGCVCSGRQTAIEEVRTKRHSRLSSP